MNWSQKTTPLRQMMSPLEQEVSGLELSLLRPDIRKSEQPAQLLADDFLEFGSSGHMFSKEEILESLKTEPVSPRSVDDMQVRVLAPHVVLVTYRVHYDEQPAAQSLRSSVWTLRDGRWQMIFLQGTPCPTAK